MGDQLQNTSTHDLPEASPAANPFVEEIEADRIVPAEPVQAAPIHSIEEFKAALERMSGRDLAELWTALTESQHNAQNKN